MFRWHCHGEEGRKEEVEVGARWKGTMYRNSTVEDGRQSELFNQKKVVSLVILMSFLLLFCVPSNVQFYDLFIAKCHRKESEQGKIESGMMMMRSRDLDQTCQ